jgi:hypothetical protein
LGGDIWRLLAPGLTVSRHYPADLAPASRFWVRPAQKPCQDRSCEGDLGVLSSPTARTASWTGKSRCEKSLRSKHALKKFRIEHQLQLARRFRWGLATIGLDTLGRLVLEIRNDFEIVLSGCSIRRVGWRTRAGAGPQRSFPKSAVAEDFLNDVALAALDEAHNLHLPAAARTLQCVDFVHPLDEHRPSGHRPRTCALRSRLLRFDRRTIDGEVFRFRFAGLPPLLADWADRYALSIGGR